MVMHIVLRHCGKVFVSLYCQSRYPYIKKKKEKLSGRYGFIYALVNSLNKTPFYIGCTKNDIGIRLKQHKKRGAEIVLLCICPVEFLYDEERRWILGAKKTHTITNIK